MNDLLTALIITEWVVVLACLLPDRWVIKIGRVTRMDFVWGHVRDFIARRLYFRR